MSDSTQPQAESPPQRAVASPARLPQEHVHDASWRDVALVVLAPLLVVGVINVAIALVLLARPSNRGDWLARAKWQLLLDTTQSVDTLILGDSTCNQGLNPRLIERKLGGRTLNLCTTGDKLAVGDAWMLQAYLKRQRAPRRIVVMHAYDVWARDEHTLRRVSWTIGSYRAHFEHVSPRIDWTLGERILLRLGLWVPLYNQPQASLDVVKAPREALQRKRFAISAEGFMGYDKANPKRVASDARDHLRTARNERPPLSSINREALQTVMSVARQHQAPLYVAHAPLFEGLWNDKRVRRRHKSISRALERVLAGSPDARLVSRVPATFSAQEMENADHVIGDASTRLTEQLADEILKLEAQ